jgi:hypothetical protein
MHSNCDIVDNLPNSDFTILQTNYGNTLEPHWVNFVHRPIKKDNYYHLSNEGDTHKYAKTDAMCKLGSLAGKVYRVIVGLCERVLNIDEAQVS